MTEEALTKQIWSEASRVTAAEVAVLKDQLKIAYAHIDTLNGIISKYREGLDKRIKTV